MIIMADSYLGGVKDFLCLHYHLLCYPHAYLALLVGLSVTTSTCWYTRAELVMLLQVSDLFRTELTDATSELADIRSEAAEDHRSSVWITPRHTVV